MSSSERAPSYTWIKFLRPVRQRDVWSPALPATCPVTVHSLICHTYHRTVMRTTAGRV